MKNVKIISLLIASVVLFSCLCSCNDKPEETDAQSGASLSVDGMSCEEIIDYVYSKIEKTEFLQSLDRAENRLVNIVIPKDDSSYYGCDYYFGIDIDFVTAVASECEQQPPAYSFCVAKMPEGTDMNKLCKTVKNNANPSKWVCTGVSTVYVESVGNTLALIMADAETAAEVKDAFLSLATYSADTSAAEQSKAPGTSESGGTSADLFAIVEQIYTKTSEGCWHAKEYLSSKDAPEGERSMRSGKYTSKNLAPHAEMSIDCEYGIYTAPMMEPDAYILYLFKVPSGTDVEAVKTEFLNTANPAWQMCVSAQSTKAASNGDYVLLMMGTEIETDATINAFLELKP